MKLLVDIGNHRLKWAFLVGGELTPAGGTAYAREDLSALFSRIWNGAEPPGQILVANVAGKRIGDVLCAWTRDAWDREPQFVIPQRKACGVTNAYLHPQQLGADRWAALIAARSRHAGAACVIDCGTAITVDALAATGEHLGGLIIPGLDTMRRALIDNTAGIPDTAAGQADVSLLARDSGGGIAGGTLYAAVAFIDRVVADVRAEIPGDLDQVITGGDAERVLPLLDGEYRHVPDLVLQGLARIARETR